MAGDSNNGALDLRQGETVTVRPLEEILATLDTCAKYEGVPFMPEMVPFCGKSFKVFRRAEKACVETIGIKSLTNSVHLEGLRCDGSAHDGCQRGCLFFWKEAWLQRGESAAGEVPGAVNQLELDGRLPTTMGDRYYCQSTELDKATKDLPPGRLAHYFRDLKIGQISLRRFGYILLLALLNRLSRLIHGRNFHQITGEQKKTLTAELNLQPDEWVEVKSAAEIQATLDTTGRNRGLTFEPEMALHCGRRYRVATPVRKIIMEATGKMVELNNTVILDGVACQGICAKNCHRANLLYWREIWLKRVN